MLNYAKNLYANARHGIQMYFTPETKSDVFFLIVQKINVKSRKRSNKPGALPAEKMEGAHVVVEEDMK